MKKIVIGDSQRRQIAHVEPGRPQTLRADSAAVVEGRSSFRSRVPGAFDTLLKPGKNNRKIGDRIMKGRWSGMHVYTLALEERATCPRSCAHWGDCYGNHMPWADRWRHGERLEHYLATALLRLAVRHPAGFVVRLHVLGDFYSVDYVKLWLRWLDEIPQLNIYGYTAHHRGTEIGDVIHAAADTQWDRFSIRASGAAGEATTMTLYETGLRGEIEQGIVCPAQAEDTACCVTCALCWQSRKPIVFMAH